MKKGAHIIIQDAVIPVPRDDLPAYKEKYRRQVLLFDRSVRSFLIDLIPNRSMDLVMLTFFGARERTLAEWKDIVRNADSRFEVRYRASVDGPPSDILDVVWNSD